MGRQNWFGHLFPLPLIVVRQYLVGCLPLFVVVAAHPNFDSKVVLLLVQLLGQLVHYRGMVSLVYLPELILVIVPVVVALVPVVALQILDQMESLKQVVLGLLGLVLLDLQATKMLDWLVVVVHVPIVDSVAVIVVVGRLLQRPMHLTRHL